MRAQSHSCGSSSRRLGSSTSCSPRCEASASAQQQWQQRMGRRSHARRQSVVAQAARPRHTAAYAAAAMAAPVVVGPARQALSGGDWGADEGQPQEFACVGLAQSIVDITTEESVDDELLPALGVDKGGRRVLESADERHEVLSTLDDAGCVTKITPGGSLANTLVGIARLSSAAAASSRGRRRPLRVALGTSCGSDPIGQYFTSQLSLAGVTVLPTALQSAPNSGHTGTVFVLPSQDAQRSFLSFFHSEALGLSSELLRTAGRCRLLIIEGYLWELPGAAAAIERAVKAARAGGARVALTAGDPGVVARNRDRILKVLESAGDDVMFFSNMEEACELVGRGRSCCPKSAAQQLSRMCAVAVVTDGGNGSYIAAGGRVTSVPPVEPPGGVVDTCGAGDAYAAGFIFALASGVTCARRAGAFASVVAARVISRHGAQLLEEEAEQLAALLPEPTSSSVSSHPVGSTLSSDELPPLLRPTASPVAQQWQA